MTLPLAQLPTSRVVGFEPVPPSFARLQRVVGAAWGCETPSHVTLRREALSDRSGTTTVAAPQVDRRLQDEWASIAKNYAALPQADPRIETIETWLVPVLRLDDADLSDVTALKIDVEGAELEVLHGAWATLCRWRPCLSIEIEERHRESSAPGTGATALPWL